MIGGSTQRFGPAPKPSLRGIVLGCVLLAGGLVLVVVPGAGRVATALGSVLILFGSLAIVSSAVVSMLRRELEQHVEFVNQAVERGVVEVLPPGRVAERLLERIYGPSPANRRVSTALLGGAGLAHGGNDLTISEHTEIDLRLDSLDERNYHLVMEQRYSFRNRIPTSTMVIFATSEPRLRDSIISGCRLPLFELWFVREDPDNPRFEDSVEGMRESVRVGMRFADRRGETHDVEARDPGPCLREVKIRDWGRYLDFFRTDKSDEDTLDRVDYLNALRIFEVDLHALAGSAERVSTILRLTIRSTTLQLIRDGYCYWEAPYPCFVESIRFDTSTMLLGDQSEAFFWAKPFAISSVDSSTWTSGAGVTELPLRAWLLPGHGVALIWRPLKEP